MLKFLIKVLFLGLGITGAALIFGNPLFSFPYWLGIVLLLFITIPALNWYDNNIKL